MAGGGSPWCYDDLLAPTRSEICLLCWHSACFSKYFFFPIIITLFSSLNSEPDYKVRKNTETATVFSIIHSYSYSSVAQSCLTLCDPMDWSMPGIPVHHQLPEFTQTHVHQVGDAIQPSHPLSAPSPPAFNLSQDQGLFKWASSSHQVAKVLEFQLQHQSLNEHSGLISFRMDWLDLLVVQGTLKSLLQHHSSKVSILRHSAFFIVQLSHPYMTTGKTIALTRWTFVGKVMSLFF